MARNKMKLGRRNYTVHRFGQGEYVDGIWQDATVTTRTIRANIQGGLFWNSVKFSDSGDIGKQAISIRSDQKLQQASGKTKGDFVLFQDRYWEVRDTREYFNLQNMAHFEAMAVLVDGADINEKIGVSTP